MKNNYSNFYSFNKKILEKTIKLLKEKADKLNDTNKTEFTNIVNLLFNTCNIVSGFNVLNPEQYSKKVYNLINLGLGDDDDNNDDNEDQEEVQEIEVDLEKEVEEITLDEDDNMESVD